MGLLMTFIIVFSRTNLNGFTCVCVIRKVTNTPTEQTMQYFVVFMFCRYIATFFCIAL